MNKGSIYVLVGLAWLMCCGYQFKNDNKFMIIFSAILAAVFFILAIHKKIHQKK